MKKRILISINANIFVRNYLNTNAFKELKKKYKLFYCIKEGEVSKNPIVKKLNNFEILIIYYYV